MRKLIYFLFAILLLNSCSSCNDIKREVIVENTVQADITDMKSMYKDSQFVWLETLVLLNHYLDEENDGTFKEVTNVFQAVEKGGKDSKVYKYQHYSDGINFKGYVEGFWIEDFPLVDSLVKVPYDSAYSIVMKVNLPKPHSKQVCLRKPIGPNPCNPQWIFGNIHSQIWIDAITGEVKESNPAFPDGFKYIW